ncbi:MAG: alpha-L-rhamnosidase N-terminal domain-containing protein [Lachnospiraceae bacterium]|nr:alpha-L-rhamnosidase N-terminal domain-containing protein [Lachnospiraceae bacterium]
MKKRIMAWMLALAVTLAALAGCRPGTDPAESGTEETRAQAPDREEPDRADLKYTEAIERYRKTDWTADWIWTKNCPEDSYAAFRKTFTLDADLAEATAWIASVDKYVLWVNGELQVLDGSVKRGPTPYDTYYDTVTVRNLKKGENVIALLVAFNGRSGDGSIVPVLENEDGDEVTQAGLLFEMKAGDTVVRSDSTWKAKRHDAYKNRVSGGTAYVRYDQSSMLAERNVFYNAADDIGDFQAAGYDDSGWEDATPVARPGDIPFGALYSAITAPIRFGARTDFANAAEYIGKTLEQDTTLVLELPGNIQFTWYLELDAPAGKKLTVYTDTYTDRQDLPNFKDTYVTGAGAQHYENWPWRSGSKLIIEAEAGVTFRKLQYRPSGIDATQAGAFESADADLVQLWQESLNTIAICMRDSYMDCPDRERGPYMGDASNQIDAALYAYDEGGLALTKRVILACIGWIRQDGAIPSRAPSEKPQEIPNQSLAFMTAAYHYWLHSGDTETMTAYYQAFVNYLGLFEMKQNGLPAFRSGSWSWNDWGSRIDTELLQTGFYYYALRLTARLADELGISEGKAFLEERMTKIRENWRAAFLQEDGFRSAGSQYVDDRANAMLVLSGLAEEADYERIAAVLEGTLEASPFMEKYVLEALCVMGRTDLALQRMRTRYAPMLEDAWDTLWEQFNDVTGTYNHGWTAAPLYILSKYVAGVQPVKAGFAEYEVRPYTGLTNYSCTVWTPRGTVTVVKEGSSLTVTGFAGGTLVLPDGTRTALQGGTYTCTVE